MSQHVRYTHLQLTKCIISRQLGTSVNTERQKKSYDTVFHTEPLPLVYKDQNQINCAGPYNIYLGWWALNNVSKRPEGKLKDWQKPPTSLWDINHGKLAQSVVIQKCITKKSVTAFADRHERVLNMKRHKPKPRLSAEKQKPCQGNIFEIFEQLSKHQHKFLDELQAGPKHNDMPTQWQNVEHLHSHNVVPSNVCQKEMKSQIYSATLSMQSETRTSTAEASSVKCQDRLDSALSGDKDKNKNKGKDRPSLKQLKIVEDLLVEKLPKFFSGSLFSGKEHPNIVFVNRYYGKEERYVGKFYYLLQMIKVFLKARLAYPMITVNILSITTNKEDGTVLVRWQIQAVPYYEIVLNLFMSLFSETDKNSMCRYHDGYSVFTVGIDGQIHQHVVDRKMRDSNLTMLKLKEKIAGKLMPKLQGNVSRMCGKDTDNGMVPNS